MSDLKIHTNPAVEQVFNNYPDNVRKKLLNLRKIIVETASEIEGLVKMEETLKWGEPSYLVKSGSTLRIDWKKKTPNQYAIYFKCTSKLVPSFKKAYPVTFHYEGNRAINFQMNNKIPEVALKNCIKAGLRYHKLKQLPNLGL